MCNFITIGIVILSLLILFSIFMYIKNKSKTKTATDSGNDGQRSKPPEKPEKAKRIKINIMANRQVSIENITKVNNKTYEFDTFIQGDNFELTSYQGVLGFNQNVINGGVLTFEYLTGTCEIGNPPAFGLGVNSTDGPKELTYGSGPGSSIISAKKRLGKFRLTNTVNFASNQDLNLQWNFAGTINTIFTGTGFNNITNTILFSIIIGDRNMITINENQKVLLTAQPLSQKGNPAPIDGAVTWTVTAGSQFVSLTPVDNFSVYAVAVGPLGLATVQAQADADLGTGVSLIIGNIDVEVVGGQAVTLNIIAGTPELQ